MEEFADAVVVAEVVYITHDAPQEASSLQHFYVQLRIIEDWSRSKLASDRVVVVNSGSGSGAFDEVDPRYTVGEEYWLEPPRYWTVSPQGRAASRALGLTPDHAVPTEPATGWVQYQ